MAFTVSSPAFVARPTRKASAASRGALVVRMQGKARPTLAVAPAAQPDPALLQRRPRRTRAA